MTDKRYCPVCKKTFFIEWNPQISQDIPCPECSISTSPSPQGGTNDYHEKKWDQGKLRWDLLYYEGVEKIVEIATYGIEKGYKEDSWKDVPDGQERYFAALMRHLMAWRKGEIVDPESGKPHIWHVAWNALALIFFEEKKYGDD